MPLLPINVVEGHPHDEPGKKRITSNEKGKKQDQKDRHVFNRCFLVVGADLGFMNVHNWV